MPKAKNPFKLPMIVGCSIVGLPVLVLVGFVIWFGATNLKPLPKVPPPPKLPSPNGYDYFVSAGKLLKDQREIDEAYLQSIHQMKGSSGTIKRHVYTLAEKRDLVAENARAIAKLRQGLALPYQQPAERSISQPHPEYADFRSLGKLLALSGSIKEKRGDLAGAIGDYLQVMQVGFVVPRGGTVASRLVGISMQGNGRSCLGNMLSRLSAEDAVSVCGRLQYLMDHRYPLVDSLTNEKWMGQSSLQDLASHPDKYAAGPEALEIRKLRPVGGPFMRWSANNYIRYMDRFCNRVKQPYSAKLPDPPLPKDPLSKIVTSMYRSVRFADVRNDAQNTLLITALALRAYRMERGHYPETLQELSPSYLKRMPVDPFALRKPLCYRRNGAKYVLYSIGPDGRDDGGKPIDDPKGNAHPKKTPKTEDRYDVWENSKGDIVAGINTH